MATLLIWRSFISRRTVFPVRSALLQFLLFSAFLWLTRVSLQLQSLLSENISLRRQVSTQQPYPAPGGPDHPNPSSPSSSSSSSSSSSALKRHLSARASRTMSMYETGSGLKPFLPKGETPFPEETFPTLQPFPTYVSKNLPLSFFFFLALLFKCCSMRMVLFQFSALYESVQNTRFGLFHVLLHFASC